MVYKQDMTAQKDFRDNLVKLFHFAEDELADAESLNDLPELVDAQIPWLPLTLKHDFDGGLINPII